MNWNKIIRIILLIYICVWIIIGGYGFIAMTYLEKPMMIYLILYALLFGLFLGGGLWIIFWYYDQYRKKLEE